MKDLAVEPPPEGVVFPDPPARPRFEPDPVGGILPIRRPIPGNYMSRRVDLKLNSKQQRAAAYLVQGLAVAGAVADNGRVVNSPALAVLWILNQLSKDIDKAEEEHDAELRKYAKQTVEWDAECDRRVAEALEEAAKRFTESDGAPDEPGKPEDAPPA